MKKVILKFSIKFFILCIVFALLFSAILFLSFRDRQNVLAIESGDTGGWFWSPLIGWASQSCTNRYYDSYQNYCGILTNRPVLDVNFDGADLHINTSIIRDGSGNSPRIDGTYRLSNAGVFSNKIITPLNIKNRYQSSNYNGTFFDFDKSAIEFSDQDFMQNQGNEFSVSLWFKIDTEKILENQKAFLFSNGYFNADNSKYYCYLYKSGGISINTMIKCGFNNAIIDAQIPGNINPQFWYNVTIVNNSLGNLKLYLNYTGDAENCPEASEGCNIDDGFLGSVFSIGPTSNSNNINKRLILGNMISSNPLDNYTGGFLGEVDEFRFFNKALTASEVKTNMSHNSNYGLNIDEEGNLKGWSWSSHYGWICFGDTCSGYGVRPASAINATTKLHETSNSSAGIYKDMITGWAKIIGLNRVGSDVGWISLNSSEQVTPPAGDKTYLHCSSCSLKDIETDLISYFKMDEQAGDVISDYSGLQRNATLVSNNENFSYPNGKVNSGIYLDGDDYIRSDHLYDIGDQDFSIELWIKPLGTEEITNIIDSTEFNLNIENNNNITFTFLGKTQTVSYNFDETWHHILVSIQNENSFRVYIDKDIVMTQEIPRYEDLQFTNLIIGSDYNYANNFFGYVDIFRLYTKTFSDIEVADNYEYPEKKLCSACFYVQNVSEKINICYDCKKCYLSDTKDNNCKSCIECRKYGLVFDSNSSNIKGFAWSGPDPNTSTGEKGLGWIKFSPTLSAGLYKSYVSGKYGNIYSRANIGSEKTIVPPVGQYNATYLIEANGNITNWISEQIAITQSGTITGYDYSSKWISQGIDYDFPSSGNSYGNILGSLDYDGIIGGEYGEVLDSYLPYLYECLGGKIYKPRPQSGEVVLRSLNEGGDSYIFLDKGSCDDASGIFVIDGDLVIEGNISYGSAGGITKTKQLSSVVWIVRGDLHINPSVTKLAGTFIVLGGTYIDESGVEQDIQCGDNINYPTEKCGIIYTGESNLQLVVSGQFLAKNFQFQRTYKSDFREPAELIIYDGRNIINPPPGLGDAIKSLPRWDQIAPY